MAETTADVANTTQTSTASAGASPISDAATVASGSQASATASADTTSQSAYSQDDIFSSTLDLREPGTKRRSPYSAGGEDNDSSDLTADAASDADASLTDSTTADGQSPADATEANTETSDAAPAGDASFDADLLANAQWYGFTEEDAKAFGTPDALRRVLTAMDRRALSDATKSQSQPNAAVEGEATQQPQATEASTAADAKQSEVSLAQLTGDVEKFNLEPLLEGWDEDTKKLFSQLNDHYDTQMRKIAAQAKAVSPVNEQVAQLSERFQALEQFRLQAEGERIEQEFDGLFNSVGAEYADAFGKGTGRELRADSKELQTRKELVQEMFALRDADERFGRPPMTNKQLFNRALAVRFFDKSKDLAVKQVKAEVAQRKSQSVAKPTQRRSAPVTGEKAAANFVNQFFKERGVDLDASSSELLSDYS